MPGLKSPVKGALNILGLRTKGATKAVKHATKINADQQSNHILDKDSDTSNSNSEMKKNQLRNTFNNKTIERNK